MKIKVCQAPVYLHSMGPDSMHIDVEHPILDHIIEDGERTSCQGKGHGIFVSLDPAMLSRAEGVVRTRMSQGHADDLLLNERVVGELNEIGDALAYLGDQRRASAYRRAARSIQQCRDDLAVLAREGRLKTLKWVGPSVAALVDEILSSDKTDYLRRLQSHLPFSDLLRIEKIDTRTGLMLHQKLGISTVRELEDLVTAGTLQLDPQPITLEDELTLEIHKRRAGRHAPILDLLFEGFALIAPLRWRFSRTSICYDSAASGTRRNILRMIPAEKGIRIVLGARSLPEEVDRENMYRSIKAIVGDLRTTISGRVILCISTKDAAWKFPRVLRDHIGG